MTLKNHPRLKTIIAIALDLADAVERLPADGEDHSPEAMECHVRVVLLVKDLREAIERVGYQHRKDRPFVAFSQEREILLDAALRDLLDEATGTPLADSAAAGRAFGVLADAEWRGQPNG